MSELGQKINFKQLLDRHGTVEVPRIQRDYAQGRENEAEVLDGFLNALREALTLPAGDSRLPLNLDFIYGSVEGKDSTRFLPLDGQQRLTTLFLLHWYCAWRDNQAADFRELFCDGDASRFSYSVRPSSTEFFNALVAFEPREEPTPNKKLSDIIKDQRWYFRHWRLDPTIHAVLRALDAIHDKFRDRPQVYDRLVDEENPAITFQLLDLKNFGLSDDLYIKMNARGKPLTPFETFKARLEQTIKKLYRADVRRCIGDDEFSMAEFFSRRMDTKWADFFWAHRDEENLFDAAVLNLFRTVILITRDAESDTFGEDIRILSSSLVKSSFALFHSRGWIDQAFVEAVVLLLETWSADGAELAAQLPDNRYFDEDAIFVKIAAKPTDLHYRELIQLRAYLSFLEGHENHVCPEKFQEWMRLIHNLAVNTGYNQPSDFPRCLRGILTLLPYSGDILKYLAENDIPPIGFSQLQVQEEKLKAKLILADDGWRPLIDRAEAHDYFKGQIEFLLDFCGALDRWKAAGEADWSTSDHESMQADFAKYLSMAEVMFNESGLTPEEDCRWERALLSLGDYLLSAGTYNRSFLVNAATEEASWKRLLRGPLHGPAPTTRKRRLLKALWDRMTPNGSLAEQLDAIIEDARDLELWRKAFVKNPEAIKYCRRRLIRWNWEQEIYLLRKTQMNGTHAELFTYCLHDRLRSMDLAPLKMLDYCETTETAFEPRIRFDWDGDETRYFDLKWNRGQFELYRLLDPGDTPEFVPYLVKELGFEDDELRISKTCAAHEIENLITDFRNALTKYAEREEVDA